MAMVEPFISHRVDGRVRNELTAEAMIRAMTVAAGLGTHLGATPGSRCRSSTTWNASMAATTLPALILGGEVADDPDAAYAQLEQGAALPTVQGLVIGRSLLYPPGDDVAGGGRRGGEPAVTPSEYRWCAPGSTADGPFDAWSSRRRRPAGRTAACGCWSCRPAASATFDTGDGRDAGAAAGRRLRR